MSKPPSKAERAVCYDARDKYFACLSKNDDDIKKCMDFRKIVEEKCPKPWIKHFEQNRMQKELLDSYKK